jgi:large subunit ribosomal protein L10
MLRPDKSTEVKRISERLQGAKAAIIAEYRGLTVSQMTELRSKIRAAEGGFRVIKNRLAKLALKDTPTDGIDGLLTGPTALATAQADPVPLAKVLVDFAKEHEPLVIKGGNVEGKPVDLAGIQALATLPGRPELLSMLLSVMHGPARGTASVLAAIPRSLVTVIQRIGESKP